MSKKSKVKSVKNRLRATDNKGVKGVPPVPDRFSRLFADAPLSIDCTFEHEQYQIEKMSQAQGGRRGGAGAAQPPEHCKFEAKTAFLKRMGHF